MSDAWARLSLPTHYNLSNRLENTCRQVHQLCSWIARLMGYEATRLTNVQVPNPMRESLRYAKRAANYRAMVVIASLMVWLQP